MGRRLALLIGTYQFQDAGLRQLTAPAHDAETLGEVLRAPDIAGFEVTVLVNESHHRVGEAISELYRDRRRDDLTLLYFTGHGLKDDGGRLYLATVDTRRDSLLFTALSAEHIDRAMEDCASRQKVLILDCCYSGAYPAGWVAKSDPSVHTLERFQGQGRAVLTASDATQYSFEGDVAHGDAPQSVFTRHLIAGLRDGSADLDGDGDITLDELYQYVHDRVVAEVPQQRPKRQDNVQGRIVIARNINWSLPAYLRRTISSPIATERLGALDALTHLYQIGNDLVRAAAREQIERLADDDSRLVSASARQLLATWSGPAGSTPAQPPEPESPVRLPPPESEPPGWKRTPRTWRRAALVAAVTVAAVATAAGAMRILNVGPFGPTANPTHPSTPATTRAASVRVVPIPAATTPTPRTCGYLTDRLCPGDSLFGNQYLFSPNGRYRLHMQDDGNLVLYEVAGAPPKDMFVWATDTSDSPHAIALLRQDGELVVLTNSAAREIWSSGTAGNPGSVLRVQDDGRVAIYAPGNRRIWTRPG